MMFCAPENCVQCLIFISCTNDHLKTVFLGGPSFCCGVSIWCLVMAVRWDGASDLVAMQASVQPKFKPCQILTECKISTEGAKVLSIPASAQL